MTKKFILPLALLLVAGSVAVSATAPASPATNTPSAPAAALNVVPAEKLLPDDTLAMFTIPDFNRAREIYHNSPQGQFWSDPAMKDFKDKFWNKFSANVLGPLQKDLGVRFDDYVNLPQGQLTLAFIQNGWAGKEGEPSLLLLLDTKSKSAQLTTNLNELKKKWANAGKNIRTEKIRDVDFSIVTVSKADFIKPKSGSMGPGLPDAMPVDPKDMPKHDLYIGQAGSLLVVGDSSKVIEKVLARMSGGAVNVLNDLAAFDASRAMFHDAPLFGWVNTKGLVDIFSKSSETTDAEAAANPFAFQTDKILAGLGLNALKSLAFNFRVSNDGSEFNVNFSVPEGRRAGILKILAGEVKDCSPPPFVPADAVKFQRWRFDGPNTWTTLRKTVGDVLPAAVGGMDFVLNSVEAEAKEKDPSFSLNKNLFGNLGGDIISYDKAPRGMTAADMASPPSICLIGSPNPDQFADAMKRVMALYAPMAGAAKDREFLGHKIYTISLPNPPAAKTSSAPRVERQLSYTTGGGYMAISTDPAMLEEYLRSSENQPKSLRDLPGLTDAMQKVTGTGASLFGFSNEAESMRTAFEAMRNNIPGADPMAGFSPILTAMNAGDVKSKDWFDAGLLPPFSQVSKYFYFTVYGAITTPDSINIKVFAPTPPALKK